MIPSSTPHAQGTWSMFIPQVFCFPVDSFLCFDRAQRSCFLSPYTGCSHLFSVQFQREHVLENMFSVHTISSSMNDVLKSRVPARTVPAGTHSNHVLGTNRPVSMPPKQVWTLRYREQCSNWAGLSTQLRRAHVITIGQLCTMLPVPVNHLD